MKHKNLCLGLFELIQTFYQLIKKMNILKWTGLSDRDIDDDDDDEEEKRGNSSNKENGEKIRR